MNYFFALGKKSSLSLNNTRYLIEVQDFLPNSMLFTAKAQSLQTSDQEFATYYCLLGNTSLHHLKDRCDKLQNCPYVPKILALGTGLLGREGQTLEVYAIIAEQNTGTSIYEALSKLDLKQRTKVFLNIAVIVNNLLSKLIVDFSLSLHNIYVNDSLEDIKVSLPALVQGMQVNPYLPPEILCSPRGMSKHTDHVFVLGVLLFQLLTGYSPHFRADCCDYYYGHLFGGNTRNYWKEIAKISTFSFTADAKDLMEKLLAKDPLTRIAKIEEIITHPFLSSN